MADNRVTVDFDEEDVTNERGREQPGICATCQRCGHQVKGFGTGESTRKYCLAKLRQTCPEGEENFYVDAEEEP